MAINKVKYGNQTLIDLSTDTVSSAEHILLGKVGHLRDGTVVTGTASGGDQHGTIWQDGQGNVHLDDESGIALQSKTATPSESQQVIEADEGYYALDTVTVNAISSSYVGSGVTRRSSSDLTAVYDTVNVPAGYYASQASKTVAAGTQGTPTLNRSEVTNNSVTITPTVINIQGYINGGRLTGNSTTVTASQLVSGTYSVTSSGTKDVTNYASASVPAGTEGTPTATKGTVSNNSVTVTPSVTNTGGYITGSTKTGTAVTVSASELVSGTKSITENGTGIDVTNYASVDVNVVSTPTYTATITRAGSSSSAYITYKKVKYYTVGTFTFTAEDDFSVVATGNIGGKITYNDDVYNSTSESFTFPNSDITISMSTGSTGTVNIQTSMLPITANGKYEVNGYDRVNVSVGAPFTATITRTGIKDDNYPVYCHVTHNGTAYYTKGDTFVFDAGDTLRVTIETVMAGQRILKENGVVIASGTTRYWTYNYTLPSYDIDIQLYQIFTSNVGSVNISKSESNCKLIASTTYQVNTTSTTSITVGTFSTGDTSIWTSDKMVYVKIRRKNSRENGYYFGSDCIFSINAPGNNLTATESYLMYGTSYYQNSAGNLINYNLQRTAANATVQGYGVYATKVYSNGDIDINARYDSSYTLRIDGTFYVDVYLLDWPGGIGPFNE